MDPIYSLKNLFRTSLRGNDFLLHGPDVWSSCIAIFTALIRPYSVTMLLNRNLFVLHRSVTCLSLLKALSGNRRLKDKSPITAQGSEAVLLWCASPTFFALTPFFAPAECQDVIRVEIPGYSAISDWPPSQAMVKNCWMTEGGGGGYRRSWSRICIPIFTFLFHLGLHTASWELKGCIIREEDKADLSEAGLSKWQKEWDFQIFAPFHDGLMTSYMLGVRFLKKKKKHGSWSHGVLFYQTL